MSGPPQTVTRNARPGQRTAAPPAAAPPSPLSPRPRLDLGKTATPVLVARLRNVLVTVTLIFAGMSGILSIAALAGSEEAAAAVAQSARLRGIAISLSQAEQIVADQVLAGTTNTTELDVVTKQAVSDLVEAAAASPERADELSSIAGQVTDYRSVAAVALRDSHTADSVATDGVFLAVSRDSLFVYADESDAHAVDLQTSGVSAFAAVLGWLVVAGAILTMITTARRTHRVINVGLLLGAVLMSFAAIMMGVNATAASNETSAALEQGRLVAVSEMNVRQTKAAESLLFAGPTTKLADSYLDASADAGRSLNQLDDSQTLTWWREFKDQHASVNPGSEAAKELGTSSTGTSETIQKITDRLAAQRSETFAQATEATRADSAAPVRAFFASLLALGAAGSFVVGARRIRREYQAG